MSAATPTVLVVYASFKGFSPYEQFHKRFVATLESGVSYPVEVQAEFVDVMVARGDAYDAAALEYLRQKYAGDRVEVVVGIGARAAMFAAKVRAEVFPAASIAFGYVDRKIAPTIDFRGPVTGATGIVDIRPNVELALRMVPDATRLAFVVGASDQERAWYDRVVREAGLEGTSVELVPLFGLAKEDLLRRLATLPPHTVVMWGTYQRDPTGNSYAPREVLAEAREVSSAPIFGLFEYDVGEGVVASWAVDVDRLAEGTGRIVARLVNGERAENIPWVHETANPLLVDWRELERWRIDPSRLPPEAEIRFREPTVWGLYGSYIVTGGAILLIQSILIVGLVIQRSRRRSTQESLAARLGFERLIAELSTRFVDLPDAQVDAALALGLREVRTAYSADRATLLQFSGEEGDATVVHSSAAAGLEPFPAPAGEDVRRLLTDYVRMGGSLRYTSPDEISDQLAGIRDAILGLGVRSGIAVPVHTGGHTIGALLVAAITEPRAWPEDAEAYLKTIADIFANALVRKRGAAALRRSQALSDAVLKSITAQVCVLDRDGRIIAVNEAWKRSAGAAGAHIPCLFVGAECSGRPGEDAPCATVAATDLATAIRAVAAGSQETFSVEYRVGTPAGESWYLLTVEQFRVPEGGAVMSHQNITARKRAELEAEQRRQELEHVSRVSTMGELAASIAHELNQPLTGVLTNAHAAVRYLAQNPPDVEEVRDILSDIIEDDRRAGEIIRRLRSMLQKGVVDPTEVDVNEVVAAVVVLLGSDAVLRNVTIEHELADGAVTVHGDRVQLQQVVLNLVVNAMDAMKETPARERRVTIRTTAPDANTVMVSVSDRGPGIDQDKLGRIFQPFFTTKREGLGMGLSIARTIVEAHGGMLWATNNPGRGASFLCRLPAHETLASSSSA